MIPAAHSPSYYLTDEAAAQRMAKLVQRIATEGLKPGESVPASILSLSTRAVVRSLHEALTAERNTL